MIFERCRRFHRSNDGQISMLAVFGAVVLVGLLGLLTTTGDQVSQKIRMQNAVDAAALSGGAWVARGLNVTSAFNLMQTQLVGGAVLLRGLDRALPVIRAIVALQAAGYAACAAVWPPCGFPLLITRIQLGVLGALEPSIVALTNLLADCNAGLFWTVAKILEWIDAFVRETFVFFALAEANDVARANGAEYALLIPGPAFHGSLGLTLPTKKKSFREHCDPMEHGSRRRDQRSYHSLLGYRLQQGPLTLGRNRLRWIPRVFGGFPSHVSVLVYDRFTNREKNEQCNRGGCGFRRPEPYLLDTARDGLSFLAVAHRPNRKVFFGGPGIEEPPDFYTYAQVEIYNGVNGSEPDAYTQDWRVRLAPASLLERFSVADSEIEGFLNSARIFLEFPQIDVGRVLGQVANH